MRTAQARVLVLGAAALLLTLAATPLLAQDSRTVQGQLLRVDLNARTLAIRSTDGGQMEFRFTDDTKVVGADRTVPDLRTMTGWDVTVQYLEHAKDHVATQIEIHPKPVRFDGSPARPAPGKIAAYGEHVENAA